MSEPEDTTIYRRIRLPWTVAVGKLFTEQEMIMARASPSWPREYELKFSGLIGNSFTQQSIDAAIEKGEKYNPDLVDDLHFHSRSAGIDPAYGSSNFAVVITEWADGIINVLYAQEFQRPDYNEMLNAVYSLLSRYDVNKCYIDGANPSFIKSIKIQIGEDSNYLEQIARYKSDGLTEEQALNNLKIVPVNFNKESKSMLGHCKIILEDEGGRIAINKKLDKLITSLRKATDMDGLLDKELTSHNDIFDAFRLSLKFYRFEEV